MGDVNEVVAGHRCLCGGLEQWGHGTLARFISGSECYNVTNSDKGTPIAVSFTLYIDGDAFPNLLKPIVHRAIERLHIPTVVVSNKKITIGDSGYVRYILVEAGADEADHEIVRMVEAGDLVITADL